MTHHMSSNGWSKKYGFKTFCGKARGKKYYNTLLSVCNCVPCVEVWLEYWPTLNSGAAAEEGKKIISERLDELKKEAFDKQVKKMLD